MEILRVEKGGRVDFRDAILPRADDNAALPPFYFFCLVTFFVTFILTCFLTDLTFSGILLSDLFNYNLCNGILLSDLFNYNLCNGLVLSYFFKIKTCVMA